MKKPQLLLALMLFLSVIVTACSTGAAATEGKSSDTGGTKGKKSYTFKLTTIVQPDHPWVKTAERFNQELQTRSGGRMKVEIFPASQLGKEADMIQQLSTGVVDFGYITTAYLATRSTSLNGWFMPFLFKNVEMATKMRDQKSAQKMLTLMESENVLGLDWLQTGNHSILMKEGKMDTPEAFVGKKVRAPGGKVINDFYTALKASPSPMPLTEVYNALQTGIVDGVNASADSLATEKYYEAAKEYTVLNQFAFNAMVTMSKTTYDSLSPDDQKIVKEASKAAIDWGNQEVVKNESTVLDLLKSKGVILHEVNNFDAFNDIKTQIYNKYSSDPLIKSFIEEAQALK